MVSVKQTIEDLILRIEKGEIDPLKGWKDIKSLKERYVEEFSEQSWHKYIGDKFQKDIVYSILRRYINELKVRDKEFGNLEVFSESNIKCNEVISRKLVVKYGEYFLLPDVDMALVNYVFEKPWDSEVIAVVSCKTSLRERIAQACYWKLKLLSSDVTKNVRIFLATTDNDKDFFVKRGRERHNGKHRNRIIAEYELDGIYILREDFKEEWESEKVKRHERIFDDLIRIFKGNSG